MSKPTPFLWFDDNAEEAMNFYLSIFPIRRSRPSPATPPAARGRPGRS